MRAAVVQHGFSLKPEKGFAWARALLGLPPELYAGQRPSGGFTLLGSVLDLVAAHGGACAPDAAAELVIRMAPRAGRLSPRIGTFFSFVGPKALDSLVHAAQAEDLTAVVENAAYILCRNASSLQELEQLALGWDPRLQAACRAGVDSCPAQFRSAQR